jgi:hypothetical protein
MAARWFIHQRDRKMTGKQIDDTAREERLVAILSPWTLNLATLVRKKFRLETLPRNKKMMVWRGDLQTKGRLTGELKKLGIEDVEVRRAVVSSSLTRPPYQE